LICLVACQSQSRELLGLAELPPLDYSVLVTGGGFLATESSGGNRTFAGNPAREDEPIPVAEIVDVLAAGRVFQHVALDPDVDRRRRLAASLRAGEQVFLEPGFQDYLDRARQDGHDLLLVIDRLEDGPLDDLGINGRWPITLATWLLLAVGALIPDHTFESRAALRVSIRDLQTGQVLYDPLLTGGPVDLSLLERTNFFGVLVSILVPPFWVHDDREHVLSSVRQVTQRRLLLGLARDLKSEATRRRLADRAVATFQFQDGDGGRRLRIESGMGLAFVRLRVGGEPLLGVIADELQRELLGSVIRVDARYRYEARLPEALRGVIQVLVATQSGDVASTTFSLGAAL
jgi:hypothetical protein